MYDVLYLNGVTRSQRSTALSSGESEFVAGVSALADGIYLKRLLEAVLMNKVYFELRMDSSAARSILQRQGVQRTRHIATGLLWVQERMAQKEATVKPVPGQQNPADIGTKGHSQKRLQLLLGLLGFQDRVGGEEIGHQAGRVQRLQRQLLPFVLAGFRSAGGFDTEELYVRSLTTQEAEDEMREEMGGDTIRGDGPEVQQGDLRHGVLPAEAEGEPEPEGGSNESEREPESGIRHMDSPPVRPCKGTFATPSDWK